MECFNGYTVHNTSFAEMETKHYENQVTEATSENNQE